MDSWVSRSKLSKMQVADNSSRCSTRGYARNPRSSISAAVVYAPPIGSSVFLIRTATTASNRLALASSTVFTIYSFRNCWPKSGLGSILIPISIRRLSPPSSIISWQDRYGAMPASGKLRPRSIFFFAIRSHPVSFSRRTFRPCRRMRIIAEIIGSEPAMYRTHLA